MTYKVSRLNVSTTVDDISLFDIETHNQCNIRKLPDEILLTVLTLVFDVKSALPYSSFASIRVCVRWKELCETIIFRNITLVGLNFTKVVSSFLALLRDLPYLASYVRSLGIQQKCLTRLLLDVYDGENNNITEILRRCRGIRHLRLDNGHYLERNLLWVETARSLPVLKDLDLIGGNRWGKPGVPLSIVLQDFAFYTVSTMSLTRCGPGLVLEDPKVDERDNVSPITQDELLSMAPASHFRTSNITSIIIDEPKTPCYVMAHILQLPKRLQSFAFQYGTKSFPEIRNNISNYSFRNMQTLLNIHSHSLRYISLGAIWAQDSVLDSGLPDFSKFYNLEELSLARHVD